MLDKKKSEKILLSLTLIIYIFTIKNILDFLAAGKTTLIISS